MGGAKNHGIIMPDADMDQVIADFSGSAYGSAGERCMALPVAVPVGKDTADEFVGRMQEEVGKLTVGISTDPEAHYGPVVSAAHRQKIEDYIEMGVKKALTCWSMAAGFPCKATKAGFSSARLCSIM